MKSNMNQYSISSWAILLSILSLFFVGFDGLMNSTLAQGLGGNALGPINTVPAIPNIGSIDPNKMEIAPIEGPGTHPQSGTGSNQRSTGTPRRNWFVPKNCVNELCWNLSENECAQIETCQKP